jgi:HSP20 family protein
MMLKNQCTPPQIRDPFGSLFSHLFEAPIAASNAGAQASTRTTPRADVTESQAAYELCFELPGFAEQDIDVQLQDRTLTISAEREAPRTDAKDKRWHRTELPYGVLQRTIKLPNDASDDGVAAVYKAGLLTVTVPKRAEDRPAKIAVRKA